ncbi:tudor and KH domain-containing protein homolog [Phymastichus coffea]|uniref:tudor and KH domain-containing protein homolog n=1 Tax=Phymastichus coffea TaxID=108790 RepID=UPI00273B20ED|nr:tudor and KH domain-containing protein homolog [Phymastichus coffea]
MRLLPQRMLIPLLVSFSITGATVVLLYFINKKKDEENFKSGQKSEKSIKIQIPRQVVPLVIGRAGSVIRELQESTNTKISFIEDNDVDLPMRICVITGDPKNLILAEKKIQAVLINQPLIETYEQWVPQRTIMKMTEKGEVLLKQIQNSSNAKIILENSFNVADLDTKKRVIIKGTAEQIANALLLIEDRVRENNESKAKTEKGSINRVPRVKSLPIATPNDSPKSTENSKEIFDIQNNEGNMDVFVCSVNDPSQFYIQVISDTNAKLDDLIQDMLQYYENEENKEVHALREITIGQTVAAKFLDNKWYRAEIISHLDNGNYDVYFLDFGDRDSVESKNIYELRTDFLSLRFQAIECSLSGVKPKSGEWSSEVTDKFSQLCALGQWQPRVAKIRGYKERAFGCGSSRREGSPIPSIELYERRDEQLININKELIRLDLAVAESEPWSAASSTVSLSRCAKSPDVISLTSNGSSAHGNAGKHSIEQIDLTFTPKSKSGNVDVIDLTTPTALKSQRNGSSSSYHFIENESNAHKPRPANPFMRSSQSVVRNIVPAGFEDEMSADESDGYDFN